MPSTVRKYTFDDGWVGGHTDLNDKKKPNSSVTPAFVYFPFCGLESIDNKFRGSTFHPEGAGSISVLHGRENPCNFKT